MPGVRRRVLGLTLIGLLWTGISPCYSQSPGETEFVLPSDALLDECLSSPCGDIIRTLTTQNEKDWAQIRLLKIQLVANSATDSLEASYWHQQYLDERGSVVERLLKDYGPGLFFILGVWVGASAAN